MTLKIGVPSKGRLMEKTFDWFGARGVTMRQTGAEREYSGAVDGVDGVELVLLSAGEIPRELGAGRIHLGVTGSDLVREKLADWSLQVAEMAPLGFGHADLIIAVPAFWIDVDTLDDLDAAAAAFRAAHGFRLRIATKYHRLVREFLMANGVADYQLVDSQGATEGTVKNGTAEAIADITSSGETLRANHLKILSDALVHSSQAVLFASRRADWSEAAGPFAALGARLGLPLPEALT
ncbi:ATP phosphoribosyltransferase [Rhodobacter sphaeroides]|jgi:ATP phosphoribosyltransferase catalytic subunit (EC 2.4.2.17)|uniref:ATP phosphoribosyltransferase n=1 Tax=Cereibacter sphaeroides (strain ATCC 17023 / DSM 158 / JCM 6121 / CCUG 31486 / LMG 2827 / NBRC 12203 / NCIMB 8253 / ATH 2.4.1.) TaxID=272943 RepID=HIS1_CERS4|nr:ATP phosphoribosyltransferase [Cereibacter sphaeroides]O08385.1 RecName: Full=ATP phosphoribosyltransferase; Short=ATP-PRT; Short=ATP-PRTase [Cereibacter sphaeroides 2.4.1]ABA81150.1 ATP phosphoribosyltransferase catalytic subunit [Cereibacter sphaeroides 2.4.1]AMJ49457.1 ATP phosphoribosyltransferase [Cereibacter sphaeroides]ANS36169.1 ATP phosphoribosyltransferase [Cereibacter sphaeroides]AXC63441.1 ATP phosphoribosyltransferase catalytic subunit HisG [Cereibacter sphaeroides 2.4.1]AZB57